MAIQLSHTAKELYKRCPLAYHMHYNLGYREEIVGSPLPFGSAIDSGVEALLQGKTLEDALKVFNEEWINPKINGERLHGPTTTKIRFSKADQKEELADTPWGCLQVKGEMLITAFQDEVMPQIKNVISTQQMIRVTNDDGDSIIGFADLIAEIDGLGNYLMDVKTSSKAYASDAVVEGDKAPQIALYYEDLKDKYELNGAGFYVLEKGIRKREPRTRVQVLTGIPREEMIEQTFDEFQEVLHGIRMGKFESNHPACNTYFGDCICNKYAPSGGKDVSGLVQVKRKKK